MKRLVVLSVVALLGSVPAFADWDVEMEKRDAAQREAEKRAEEAKQVEMQRMKQDAQEKVDAAIRKQTMEERRAVLGKAATGKSDAEVNRLYDAKMKSDLESAAQTNAAARKALSQGQGAEAVQGVTGKSLQELENMSDAEAEALSRELEKKYGSGN